MLNLRKSEQRGAANHGWLKSKHTFSFANYYDPKHMGYRDLRVINEDHIKGCTGFDTHPHRDMEIITYVVKGALEHQDSMGTKEIIRPGEVQRMSAGSGVTHSEYNPLQDEETHLLQIWIMPRVRGSEPSYGQKSFARELVSQKLTLVVSGDARDGSIGIQQDVDLFVGKLKAGEDLSFALRPKRGAWVQIVSGRLNVNGTEVAAGDAVSFDGEATLVFKPGTESEFLLFDLV